MEGAKKSKSQEKSDLVKSWIKSCQDGQNHQKEKYLCESCHQGLVRRPK